MTDVMRIGMIANQKKDEKDIEPYIPDIIEETRLDDYGKSVGEKFAKGKLLGRVSG